MTHDDEQNFLENIPSKPATDKLVVCLGGEREIVGSNFKQNLKQTFIEKAMFLPPGLHQQDKKKRNTWVTWFDVIPPHVHNLNEIESSNWKENCTNKLVTIRKQNKEIPLKRLVKSRDDADNNIDTIHSSFTSEWYIEWNRCVIHLSAIQVCINTVSYQQLNDNDIVWSEKQAKPGKRKRPWQIFGFQSWALCWNIIKFVPI